MSHRRTSWWTIAALLWAVAACAQDSATAPADTLASAATDTAAAAMSMQDILNLTDEQAALAGLLAEQEASRPPFIENWTIKPDAAFSAKMQKTGYTSNLSNTLELRDNSTLTQTMSLSLDDFRAQEKIVENRSAGLTYATDTQRALVGTLNLNEKWVRDEITNSVGTTNVNKRETRLAVAKLDRKDLELGGTSHDLSLNGAYTQQLAEQLGQRNDISEGSVDGALRSSYEPSDWLSVHSGVYARGESGERRLGIETKPSSASGDSVRAGVFYERGVLTGGMTISTSSFEKRYLDYNRSANGVVDTIGVAEKIVQELERDDAVTMRWSNTLLLWGVMLEGELARDMSENSFQASRVGTRERRQDTVDLTLGFRPTSRDTVTLTYGYRNKWDDQTYKGASESRGRQVNRRHDLVMNLNHELFRHTDLKLNLRTGLSQDIAEGGFNVNDRDRLESGMTVKMDTRFPGGVTVNLSFDARRTEDISIRRERSGNNTIKDTYEIAPGYLWPVAEWLDLSQNYRVWIQYTDYVFSEYEDVNKSDDYNKRGNVNTQVTIKPTSRLTLTIRHDLNVKTIAKQTRVDATGASYYNRDSDQTVSDIDFALSYRVSNWLSLSGTTFRKRDFKETFGTTTRESERFSREVAVGGELKKNFGTGKSLTLGARRYFADGPNVQEVNRDYWDADLKLGWTF